MCSAWKQKARKLLKSGAQRNDLTKITPLILEANSIPLFSRVKVYCQQIFDDLNAGISPAGESAFASTSTKRVSKLPAMYSEGMSSITPSLVQAAHSINIDDFNSTDDEETESTATVAYSKISIAPAALKIWPPAIAFGPKEVFVPAPQQPVKKPTEESQEEPEAKKIKLEEIAIAPASDPEAKASGGEDAPTTSSSETT